MAYDAVTRWLLILVIAAGTYALRSSFVLLFGRLEQVPPRAKQALRYVPPAVLAALVLPNVVMLDGRLALSPSNHQLLAGLAAGVVAWRTENMFATIVVGMGVLWTLTYLG